MCHVRELLDLVAQVCLEFLHIATIERWVIRDERSPLRYLGFQPLHAQALFRTNDNRSARPHMPPKALVTVTHCLLCSARAALPSSVIA